MKDTKNIKIDKDLHQKLKVFCAINNLKIIDFVEKIINEKIYNRNEEKIK